MKSVCDLELEFKSVKARRVPREQKVLLVNKIREAISCLERAAALDFSFPLVEIKKQRSFLIKIDDYLRL